MSPVLPKIYRELMVKTQAARHRVQASTVEEMKIYYAAKSRSKKKGIEFSLSREDFDLLVTRADGRCEETGKVFECKTNSTGRYRDHRMSIDRIDSNGPYVLENIRLVTAAVNFAKGDQNINMLHAQKLMYLIKMGAQIDDEFFLSKDGDDPNDWVF